MRLTATIPWLLAALITLAQPARAQAGADASPFGFRPYAPFLGQPLAQPEIRRPTNLPRRRTYLVEGAVAGGVAFGLVTSTLVGVICSQESADSSCLLPSLAGGLFGALAGSAFGALIGSLLPKPAI